MNDFVKSKIKWKNFVWMPYRGAHMLTGSVSENSHPKHSHIMRLGNN